MKLVMTLMVRNEIDVIEANLEYHLAQGVDFVIITDHCSDDGTSEFLREYERMGVAMVIRDDEEGYHQGDRVTRMAALARVDHDADWVIHNDADEFWWPLVGDLRDVFSALPPRFGQIEVRRRNFRPRMDGEEPFYSRLVHRETSSLKDSKIAHRPHPEVVVATGNHSIQGGNLSVVPAGEVLEILHFPMRTYEQFERKVVQTGDALERLPDRSPLVGGEQLALLELHRAGKLRDYYDGLVLDSATLERGLQMGTIVIDRRLENFMRGLRTGELSHVRPDAPFAGTVLRRLTDSLGEIEQSRGELAMLRSAGERGQERVERLERQATELSADLERSAHQVEQSHRELAKLRSELERSVHELQCTNQALHLLRSSRLMRSTAEARRLYYRATGKG